MKEGIKVGNCGWSYLNTNDYFNKNEIKRYKSKLQIYAKLFNLVEINSTFYRLPKIDTVKRWRDEADEINHNFEFTIKCHQLITHKDPFGKNSINIYRQILNIGEILRTRIILFQSPSGFKPTGKNLDLAKRFFKIIDRNNFTLVWEVRWADDWKKEIIEGLFNELNINQCVDPLRQKYFYSKEIVYFRLHGFGKPSMYNYSFSKRELNELVKIIKSERKPVYTLFNNADCYRNSLLLIKMLNINLIKY